MLVQVVAWVSEPSQLAQAVVLALGGCHHDHTLYACSAVPLSQQTQQSELGNYQSL